MLYLILLRFGLDIALHPRLVLLIYLKLLLEHIKLFPIVSFFLSWSSFLCGLTMITLRYLFFCLLSFWHEFGLILGNTVYGLRPGYSCCWCWLVALYDLSTSLCQACFAICIPWSVMTYLLYFLSAFLALYLSILIFIRPIFCLLYVFLFSS